MSSTSRNWSDRHAPSLAEFEEMADAAFKRLPDRFREMCGDLVIRIEDFPADDVLEKMKIESEFELLGLYHGVDLAHQSVLDVTAMPEMVFLYRRPILDYWSEHEETL